MTCRAELLDSSQQNLESNEHVVQQSLRVVRGMTWSGYFYNMFCSDPSIDKDRVRRLTSPPAEPVAGSPAAPPTSRLQQRLELLSPSSVDNKIEDPHDDALDLVSRHLSELHEISVTIGETLDKQNQQLDGISSKTERVTDATLEVLLKSSQLINRNSSVKAVFLGEYCFELQTGGYLGVQDEQLVIAPPLPDLTTKFRCFSKGENIFGMMSCRTLKFVCTGYFTPVSCSATEFNRAGEMYLDLSGEYNGALMLSCNWGYGGWVRFAGSDFKLTSSLRDKDNRILVRAHKIVDGDSKR